MSPTPTTECDKPVACMFCDRVLTPDERLAGEPLLCDPCLEALTTKRLGLLLSADALDSLNESNSALRSEVDDLTDAHSSLVQRLADEQKQRKAAEAVGEQLEARVEELEARWRWEAEWR